MSVRSKVAQLIFADVFPEGSDERKAADDSIIVKEQLGGIILMEGSIGQTEEVVNRLQSKSRSQYRRRVRRRHESDRIREISTTGKARQTAE